ncbi:tail fiber domain-containing protein [Burkholderia ubonensis]|uniref:tail fiber domain-containing protein n=1 Tax=Burkholderia ubonensis TaxID=101571 RepID=UPI0009B3A61A|nr:tail fiber domain-containing protein [Burkholderia ubonensis]
MAELQKINLGTAPAGRDGDPARTANQKMNDNVDVLSVQAALTTAPMITAPRALTPDHMGKRVNVNLPVPGTIVLPPANSCGADQVTLIRNLGSTTVTLAVTSGSGDTLSLTQLNAFESALLDSNGVNAWGVLFRSRAASNNEVVSGNLSVTGGLTAGGNVTISRGASAAVFGLGANAGQFRYFSVRSGTSPRWEWGVNDAVESTGNVGSHWFLNRFSDAGAYIDTPIEVNRTTGVVTTAKRPSFAGKLAWDAGNFNPNLYAALSGAKYNGSVWVNTGGASIGGTRFLVGANGPEWPVEIDHTYTGSAGCGVMLMQACSTAAQFFQFFYYSNIVGSITHNGSSTSYNTASDYRLKENVVSMTGAVDRLMRMKPSRFNFIADPMKQEVDGFIAHELEEVAPYAVSGVKDAVEYRPEYADGYNPKDVQPRDVVAVSEVVIPQTVDHSKLVPLLTAALQEAVRRIEALEARVLS